MISDVLVAIFVLLVAICVVFVAMFVVLVPVSLPPELEDAKVTVPVTVKFPLIVTSPVSNSP